MTRFTYVADFGAEGTTDTDGAVVLFVRGSIEAPNRAEAARRVLVKCPDAVDITIAWHGGEHDCIVAQVKYRVLADGEIVPVHRLDINAALAGGR